ILNAVEEINPDLVVLGWRGRTYRRDRVLGSTIDPIMLKANRDTVVIRFGRDWKQKKRKEIDSILIPTIGGPHAALATEIARDIHRQQNSAITLMNVGRKKEDKKRADQVFDKAKEILEDIEFGRKFVISSDVAGEISKETPNHDLILIGATERSFLTTFLRGVFPEKVVQKTDKSVAMTRKWVKIRDFLKQ
ncbi:MAG: universal stress protein, partial [Halobacteriota archaeon]